MRSKGLFIFIFTSSFLMGNPKNPIEVSTNISVEVVKPIEIVSKTNIYHTVFKGISKEVNGKFNLEIKASPEQTLRFRYDREIYLVNTNGGHRIKMGIDYVLGNVFATNGVGSSGELENRVQVRSPAYGYKRVYETPYKIELTGTEMQGNYQGVVNIQIDYI